MAADNGKALSHEELFREMGRSTFCLSPAGGGMGNRLKLAIATGCNPVIIQDGVQVGFLQHTASGMCTFVPEA